MHRPVLLQEAIEGLNIRPDGIYVDGTLGSGGHAEAILERLGPGGRLFGIDRDPEALARSGKRLAGFGERFCPLHGHYARVGALLGARGVTEADGVILDLGVSSEQLDSPERGFSFMRDGPLDMRMDQGQERTAAMVVNTYSESALESLFRCLGEERNARRIARAVVARRQQRLFTHTLDLAEWIAEATGGRRGRLHPATRSFQALRMEVNGELDGVSAGLDGALNLLREGGRLVVISFHSLEDRLVKQFMVRHAGRRVALPEGGARWEGTPPPLRRLTRKAVQPGEAECGENPRARSARLRVAEKRATPWM